MECIIRGIKTEREKQQCLDGVYERIIEDLAMGAPDIRRVIASLDKLGGVSCAGADGIRLCKGGSAAD